HSNGDKPPQSLPSVIQKTKNTTALNRSHDPILKRVNFSGADLREVKFCNAKLEHVDFSGGLVDGANFVGASIKNCKGLKLSEEQTRLIEENKEKDRERSRQDLEKRKALPEYREKEKIRILLKPYVDSVIYNKEVIVVYLKSSYLFIDTQTNSEEFKSFSEVKEGLGKNKVFVQ
ncbi:pentapeptide repeat-containing protein, partial [Yersinia enterocolitica]|uniref:pentapeptide repeat-containing protein n=1 Tax=Yersinia enterocolitica TaxID=630 RepID=UPI003D02EF0B